MLTARSIAEMARRIGARPEHALRHLRRERYLLPLFRGFYYVRSPEEIRLNTERRHPLELFALAARAKRIGSWYFGLETALRLNGLTHETRHVESVICSAFYRIRGVPIGSRRFVIHKWAPELLSFGLVRRGSYRFSDTEKTVLDLAYLDLWRAKRGVPPSRRWAEHLPSADPPKLRRYLSHYPSEVRSMVSQRR